MKVVFMGTPEIAAVCLETLLAQGFPVCGVFTKPDTPQNRGMKLTQPPVKQMALAHGLPVFQPEGLRDGQVVAQLQALQPDVIAVVAYGKLLPEEILRLPRLGCINIHASLLPQLRGSGPVQWAVLQGLRETGVTAMYMAKEMDAGDIIDVRRTEIGPDETAGQLLERLAGLAGSLLADTLRSLQDGTAHRTPQNPAEVTYAPMLTKALCPMDFTKTAQELHNQVRGLNPWPVATMTLQGKRFRVFASSLPGKTTDKAPGTPLQLTKTGLEISCGGGSVLEIRTLQADGGKRMAAPDYFRGHPIL